MLLGQAVCWFYSRTTDDNAVYLSLLTARTFGGVVLVMTIFFDCQLSEEKSQQWSKEHLYFGLSACGLWFLGSAKQLFSFHDKVNWGVVCMTDRLSRHLLMDLLIQIPYALMCLGYQDLEFEMFKLEGFEPDDIHRHILRCLSALVLTTAVHGIGAFHFQNEAGRHAYFMGQLTNQVLMAVICTLDQWNHVFWPQDTAVIIFSAMVLPTLNLVLACCWYRNDKQKNE